MTGPFRLYPAEQHWWSFNDYGVVVDLVRKLKPQRVLEFGPGSSTLALIEGGADWIDSCEDDPHWFATHIERLEDRFPQFVALRPYNYGRPLFVPTVQGCRYDLGLIDGPADTAKRPAIIDYALERCDAVLVPLEEASTNDHLLRDYVRCMPNVSVEWIENTGPLAGAFALIRP